MLLFIQASILGSYTGVVGFLYGSGLSWGSCRVQEAPDTPILGLCCIFNIPWLRV